jgi:hypothetical protein
LLRIQSCHNQYNPKNIGNAINLGLILNFLLFTFMTG